MIKAKTTSMSYIKGVATVKVTCGNCGKQFKEKITTKGMINLECPNCGEINETGIKMG